MENTGAKDGDDRCSGQGGGTPKLACAYLVTCPLQLLKRGTERDTRTTPEWRVHRRCPHTPRIPKGSNLHVRVNKTHLQKGVAGKPAFLHHGPRGGETHP